MTLDDTKFQAGAKRVIASAQNIATALGSTAHAANAAQQGINGFSGGANIGGGAPGAGSGSGGSGGSGGIGGIFGFYMALRVIREIEHAIVDAGKAFVKFSVDALQTHATMQALRLEFEGIYGSGQKAAQMMAYLGNISSKSAFQLRDIAQATKDLAIAGLDVNRTWPLVQKLALIRAHGLGKDVGPEELNEAVALLRRLEGGNMGLALGPRGIGRYGISRQELEQYGAKFGGTNGSVFKGSTEDAIRAIEGATKRFDGTVEKLLGSDATKLSNLRDAIYKAVSDAGDGVADAVMGPIGNLTDALNDMTSKHFFADLLTNIYQALGFNDVDTSQSALHDAMVEVGAGVVRVAAWLEMIYLNLVGEKNVVQKVFDWMNTPIGQKPKAELDTESPADAAERGYRADIAYREAQAKKKGKGGASTAPGAISPITDPTEKALDDVNDNLRWIREYNREQVRHMEKMESKIFGSGSGITRVDLNGLTAAHGRMGQIVAAIGAVMQDLIQENQANVSRVASLGY